MRKPPEAGEGARIVGRYELLTRLGEGGMGVVHLARDRDSGERVALKILRPQVVGDDEGRKRLAREVAALERVHSRWIAEIRDADPYGEVAYVATRYVPGLSLHDFVDEEGPITGRDLWWLARCLADGISACHEVGVLHRDVKPSNVLMEGRTPVLIDFGLARVADDPKITHTGWLLGTPGYLPPEILRGDEPSTATDVHSWAATVAFAATGRPPFGTGPSTAIMDRARRGEHDLTGISQPLRGVLAAAMDPRPERRPTLDALGPWLADAHEGLPVGAPPGINADTVETPTPTQVIDVEEGRDDATLRNDEVAQAPSQPNTGAVTVRRRLMWPSFAVLAGAWTAVFPWITVSVVLALVWLLRGSSMAASRVDSRRMARGAKWYDVPRMILGAPLYLVRSLPSTAILVLWSTGIALAAALICYAISLPADGTLFVVGATFAGMVGVGPGGDRVRGPLTTVVHPLSGELRRWLIALLVVLALAAAGGAVASTSPTFWTPWDGPPIPSLPSLF